MHRRQKSNRREPPVLRPEPWLVYSHGKQKQSQTFYSLSERSCQVRNIPKMRNRTVWAHCQGWLALVDVDHNHCSLFNPVTMEEVHLPRFPFTAKSIDHCALSSPPTGANNCLLMCIEYCQRRKQSSFHFCKPGDKDWTTQLVEPQQGQCWCEVYPHLHRFRNTVSFNGEFYVVSICCKGLFKVQLAIDQLGSNNVSMELLDMKLRGQRSHFVRSTMMSSSFMVQASPTELMTVKLYYGDNRDTDCSYKVRRVEGFQTGVKRLDLYKANFQEEKWERVETLPEDTAIFLGSRSDNAVSYKIPRRQDLVVVGGGGVRGNTVYFTPPTNDGYLYAYDVGDRSISVSLPCSKANRPDYSEPHWIIPLGCSSSMDDPQPEFDISPDEIGSEQIILSTGNDGSSTDHDGRHWSYDIPSELLSDVQSRLFGADCCFFRLACKTWNSIFSSVVSTSSNVRFARNHSFPILVHKGLDGEVVSLFNPITSVTSILSLEASSLRGTVIRCSKHGWLLMSQGLGGDQHRLFFFNPFTEDRINLPMLSYDLEGITFSSSPTSFDCLVICYTALWQQVVISFIYRGEHQWTQYEVMSDSSNFMSPFSNPIYHKGLLYFMGKNADLCIHDFEQKTTITIEFPNRSCTSVQRSYLLECNGKLLSVLMGHMGKVLEVYALDQEAITWKELDNLEDNMLFVSAASALSATNSGEKISGLGNKVFLDRFKDKDGVFYSLATRKFHTFWSGYNNDDWCNTKEYINCAWIEPSFKTHTKDELQW